jgi:hypothetical protein
MQQQSEVERKVTKAGEVEEVSTAEGTVWT